MLCLHCHEAEAIRRGLCQHCYRRKPGVRQQYPRLGPYGRRADDDRNCYQPALEPTDALPGSAEKQRVIAGRLADYREVDHPQDTTDEAGIVDGQIRLLRDMRLIPCQPGRPSIERCRLAA